MQCDQLVHITLCIVRLPAMVSDSIGFLCATSSDGDAATSAGLDAVTAFDWSGTFDVTATCTSVGSACAGLVMSLPGENGFFEDAVGFWSSVAVLGAATDSTTTLAASLF